MPSRQSHSRECSGFICLPMHEADRIRKDLAVLCGIVEGVSMRLGDEKTPEAFLIVTVGYRWTHPSAGNGPT